MVINRIVNCSVLAAAAAAITNRKKKSCQYEWFKKVALLSSNHSKTNRFKIPILSVYLMNSVSSGEIYENATEKIV